MNNNRYTVTGSARVDLHIRLPEDLHQQLAAEADRLGISLNALIVIQLREMQ